MSGPQISSGRDELATSLHREAIDGGARSASELHTGTLTAAARRLDPLRPLASVATAVAEATARAAGLGVLDPLLADAAVTEVMVNGDGSVFVEQNGRLHVVDLQVEPVEVLRLIERVVAPLGLRIDRSTPMVDARLADGSQVNAVVPPLAVDGPCLTIRRFGARRIALEDLAGPAVVDLLTTAVSTRANLVVSGGTGAGKTTMLNALSSLVSPGERIITVEDTAELALGAGHVVRLEARPATADGLGEVTVRDLLRNALRMRPDRLVVGEVRGAEALDMVQALNTGHDGSMSTCHANGPREALRRLETLVLLGGSGLPHAAVRDQLRLAVDLVVHVGRAADGARRVLEVLEVAEVGSAPDDDGLVLARGDLVVAPATRTARHRPPARPVPSRPIEPDRRDQRWAS